MILLRKPESRITNQKKKKQSRRELIMHEAYWSCGLLRKHLNKPIRWNISGDLNHDAEKKLSNPLETPEGKAATWLQFTKSDLSEFLKESEDKHGDDWDIRRPVLGILNQINNFCFPDLITNESMNTDHAFEYQQLIIKRRESKIFFFLNKIERISTILKAAYREHTVCHVRFLIQANQKHVFWHVTIAGHFVWAM